MTPARARFWVAVAVATALAAPLAAQTTFRLPLPVDSPGNTLPFEAPAPTAGVLTGFLWPSSGPLTSWAPVYSTLGADGSLTEVQAGGWIGPRPDRWLKVVRPGFVVAGLRVLVKTAPGALQTRQAQVFWRSWKEGAIAGPWVESAVHGAPAGPADTVRIVELRLPEGAVPTGLYGQRVGAAVAQVSLLVREAPPPPAAAQAPPAVLPAPVPPRAPVVSPLAPVTPVLPPLN